MVCEGGRWDREEEVHLYLVILWLSEFKTFFNSDPGQPSDYACWCVGMQLFFVVRAQVELISGETCLTVVEVQNWFRNQRNRSRPAPSAGR